MIPLPSILYDLLDFFFILHSIMIITSMMVIMTIDSNNVPTTAPLITATLTESSSLSLVDTLDTTVPITKLFHITHMLLNMYRYIATLVYSITKYV